MKTREAVLTALETQAVISKPRPNPRIRRFLTTVHRGYTFRQDATGLLLHAPRIAFAQRLSAKESGEL